MQSVDEETTAENLTQASPRNIQGSDGPPARLLHGGVPYDGAMDSLISSDPDNGPLPRTWFYHQDHLGSAQVITDARGREATRFSYTPFGEVDEAHSTGNYSVTYDFTGQERDPENGLMYYKARFYDPAIGRFLNDDTIVQSAGNSQAFDRYAYVRNNPITNIDPSGRWSTGDVYRAGRRAVSTTYNIVRDTISGIGGSVSTAANAVADAGNTLWNNYEEFVDTMQEYPEIGAAYVIGTVVCGPGCGLAAASYAGWATGNPNIRHFIVDVYSAAAFVGGTVACGGNPACGSAAAGFVQGFGYSRANGENFNTAFRKGLVQGFVSGTISYVAGDIGAEYFGVEPMEVGFEFLKSFGIELAWREYVEAPDAQYHEDDSGNMTVNDQADDNGSTYLFNSDANVNFAMETSAY